VAVEQPSERVRSEARRLLGSGQRENALRLAEEALQSSTAAEVRVKLAPFLALVS